MSKIVTARLNIMPTNPFCWSIFDRVDEELIGKMYFKQQWFNIILKPQSLHLGVATEASYGLMKALNKDFYQAKTNLVHAQKFLYQLGFKAKDNHFEVTPRQLTCPDLYQSINTELSINTNQLNNPWQSTAAQLVEVELDCFERPTKLHPKAKLAWQALKAAANSDSVNLQLASAFRSMRYQAGLIQRKINNAESLTQILKTNTAPGHSEHHTGRAIDITTNGFKPLEESFELSPAFHWLMQNAAEFGFVLSYPKDNKLGIIYEPWHWCYHHQ